MQESHFDNLHGLWQIAFHGWYASIHWRDATGALLKLALNSNFENYASWTPTSQTQSTTICVVLQNVILSSA
jgi:hypothetical protein